MPFVVSALVGLGFATVAEGQSPASNTVTVRQVGVASAYGQGIIVEGRERCVVVTPAHVVGVDVAVELFRGQERMAGQVIYRDVFDDYAIVEPVEPLEGCRPAPDATLVEMALSAREGQFWTRTAGDGTVQTENVTLSSLTNQHLRLRGDAGFTFRSGISGSPVFFGGIPVAIIASADTGVSPDATALRLDYISARAGGRLKSMDGAVAEAVRAPAPPSIVAQAVFAAGERFRWPTVSRELIPVAPGFNYSGSGVYILTEYREIVRASENATVASVGAVPGIPGITVSLNSRNKFLVIYGGLNNVNLELGDIVERGQEIGDVGTNNSTSAFYFEVFFNNNISAQEWYSIPVGRVLTEDPEMTGVEPTLYILPPRRDYIEQVVIWASHGGAESGLSAEGILEKDLMIEIADEIKSSLSARSPDIFIYLPRKDDEEVSITSRTMVPVWETADIEIYLHLSLGLEGGVHIVEQSQERRQSHPLATLAIDTLYGRGIAFGGFESENLRNELSSALDRYNVPERTLSPKGSSHALEDRAVYPLGISIDIELGSTENSDDMSRLKDRESRRNTIESIAESIAIFLEGAVQIRATLADDDGSAERSQPAEETSATGEALGP
jgi:N-acetylmuramoyl-L-alanine amidase